MQSLHSKTMEDICVMIDKLSPSLFQSLPGVDANKLKQSQNLRYSIQHKWPCCIGFTTRVEKEIVRAIQHGRECCTRRLDVKRSLEI